MQSSQNLETPHDRQLLRLAFLEGAKRFFETYSEIEHHWSINEGSDYSLLEIPADSEDGFEITCVVEETQVVMSYAGHHDHFELEDTPEEFVSYLLGFIYDLLSPSKRIKEYRAGKTGYKWSLEMLENGKWVAESTSALIFYNYFASKSVKVSQNHQLPMR